MFAGKSKQWFDELIYVLLYIYVQVFICKMSSPQQHVKTWQCVCPCKSHHGGIVHGQRRDGRELGYR